MSLARLVVTAVRIKGRTKAEVARDYRVSRQWVHELVRRFDAPGEAGLEPRSRRPRGSPGRTPSAVEDEIVERRKHLADQGLDAGAHTIAFHLHERHGACPSVATIWRILSRRGFVTPQPQKRPRSSFIRFEADQPNERWQADITHWKLAGGTDVEILNVIDGHSRFLVASDARAVTKAPDVVETFHQAAAAHGFPAQMLTDNGAVFLHHPGQEWARARSPSHSAPTSSHRAQAPRRCPWDGLLRRRSLRWAMTCRRSVTIRRVTIPSDRIPTTRPIRISTSIVEKNARLVRSAASSSFWIESASTPRANNPRSIVWAARVASVPSRKSTSMLAPIGADSNGAKARSVHV